ncbi:MAG: DNA recombination protein RmuC [Brevundimonas sp.]|uniref:DNA recombination protein RmuC n=1 Tax=Brevundimonas sp. TaxID=1871086 RepID=UPI001A2D77E4|nr:DNA recombination protein RmuC [Brevundimonas sp.]MBJ7446878.1 DNA recombination protein RmuC [Brevundimonas sp.]
MNMSVLILAVVCVALGAAFLWAFTGWQKTRAQLTSAEDRIALVEDSRITMADLLKAQAAQSAQVVADHMVSRATETFRQQDLLARERMEAQLKPVSETLARFQEHVTALEKVRAEETGGLKEQLALLMTASTATRDEARRLTEALKGNTGRRGRWGEQTCRNVLEAAGMAGRFDFQEQTSEANEEGRQSRPDFIVRLPGGGMFVIDAKVSLAFGDASDGDEEAQARAASLRTATSMKTHVRQLSSKAYQDQFKPSPDFVVMFVPGDAFLAAALDHEPELMTQAMASRVVIVTPTTLFALCKAVAYGWRAEEQSRNADEVAKLGKELYKRLSVMGAHAADVGNALSRAVAKYNQFVGSLETQVMVQAKRFEDLQVDHEGKALPELGVVDQSPRSLSRPELIAPEGTRTLI